MKIKGNVHYVGVNDRVKHRFEGLWFLPQGVSYNSYLIDDEATVLVDTVEVAYFAEYLDKIRAVIGDRKIDYLVINHMEPDHSGCISLIRQYYPEIKLMGNKKTMEMVKGYYGEERADDIVVTDGSELATGHHHLRFYITPMLHWPETMVTFDETEGILFSGDAFGCFGALNGHIIDTHLDTESYWPDMERYYAAILGKYGRQVLMALSKLSNLPIRMICSTHGPVWVNEIGRAIDTYRRFATGKTQPGLVICYGSMYGNTQRMAEAVAEGAAEAGMRKIIVHNLSVTQPSFVLADIFRYGALAIGSPTYNGGLFPVVEDLMRRLEERSVGNHRLGCFGGFTWSGQANRVMLSYNEKMKMELITGPVSGSNPPMLRICRERVPWAGLWQKRN